MRGLGPCHYTIRVLLPLCFVFSSLFVLLFLFALGVYSFASVCVYVCCELVLGFCLFALSQFVCGFFSSCP